MRLTSVMAASAVVALTASAATAVTFGQAVDGIGSSTNVGNQTDLGLTLTPADTPLANGTGNIIEYFIPLGSSGTCTYGDGCGTSADTGSGGEKMSMFLEFDPVALTGPASLTLEFDDLDLDPVNDPTGFLETVQVFDASGTAITGAITAVGGTAGGTSGGVVISEDPGTGILSSAPISLGQLASSPFYAELVFSASSKVELTNTVEYLRASVDVEDAVTGQIPLPAPFLMLLSALGGLGVLRWRRNAA